MISKVHFVADFLFPLRSWAVDRSISPRLSPRSFWCCVIFLLSLRQLLRHHGFAFNFVDLKHVLERAYLFDFDWILFCTFVENTFLRYFIAELGFLWGRSWGLNSFWSLDILVFLQNLWMLTLLFFRRRLFFSRTMNTQRPLKLSFWLLQGTSTFLTTFLRYPWWFLRRCSWTSHFIEVWVPASQQRIGSLTRGGALNFNLALLISDEWQFIRSGVGEWGGVALLFILDEVIGLNRDLSVNFLKGERISRISLGFTVDTDAPLSTLIAIFALSTAVTDSVNATVGGNFEIIYEGFLAKRSTKFARLSGMSSSRSHLGGITHNWKLVLRLHGVNFVQLLGGFALLQ